MDLQALQRLLPCVILGEGNRLLHLEEYFTCQYFARRQVRSSPSKQEKSLRRGISRSADTQHRPHSAQGGREMFEVASEGCSPSWARPRLPLPGTSSLKGLVHVTGWAKSRAEASDHIVPTLPTVTA